MKLVKWNRCTAIFLSLACTAISAFGGEWIVDDVTRCQVWNDSPLTKTSVSWSGECSDEKASGYGTLQWYLEGQKGSRYVGEMSEGRQQGKGIYFYRSGSIYEGSFLNGYRSGNGVLKFASGERYEGEFARNVLVSGVQLISFPNGVWYHGKVVDRQSKGTYILAPQALSSAGVSDKSNVLDESMFLEYERTFLNPPLTNAHQKFPFQQCSGPSPEFPRVALVEKIAGVVRAKALLIGGVVKAVQIESGPKVFHFVVSKALLNMKCPDIVETTIASQEFNFKPE